MISRSFTATLVRRGHSRVNMPFEVELVYDPDTDPLAVLMICKLSGEQEVVWQFSRDLLDQGTRSLHPVGIGDVRIRMQNTHAAELIVCLRPPEGHADLLLPMVDVSSFLGETFELIPLGGEECGSGIEDFLKEVLG